MTLSVATARAQINEHLREKSTTLGTVTICGGGNGAHVAAGYLASKGYQAQVLTRKPEKWGEQIEILTNGSSWEHKGKIVGRIHMISKHAKNLIPQSNVIIIAAPANAHPDILDSIAPFIQRGTAVGALFAQGGFDWAAKKALGDKLGDLNLVSNIHNALA
jgi:opine dehydrogenase